MWFFFFFDCAVGNDNYAYNDEDEDEILPASFHDDDNIQVLSWFKVWNSDWTDDNNCDYNANFQQMMIIIVLSDPF